ncbi:unnamed protein product [Clonostachys chloroleuca]|uniref:BZIP domain-containing protein n=1 Tax=Clonostachys chloroleuca TaxID=1926264 RepID=A0AA35MCC5_9HYPO|nr:unnamed protein product [Clonostachys chloroleuca]
MRSNHDSHHTHIDLASMPHEAYLCDYGEDWAGVTNQKERRKLQNRLNQRARRRRKAQRGEDAAASYQGPCTSIIVCSEDDTMMGEATTDNVDRKRGFLHQFAQSALASYATCQPSAGHLLRLIQHNVVESLTVNSAMLGFTVDWLLCSSVSPFTVYGPEKEPGGGLFQTLCPSNLLPTALQKRIPHHPWVDLFPLPQMRDNLLLAISHSLFIEGEQKLWDDMIEVCGQTDWGGMIVWGEPWDPKNWEVTLPFFKRWGWLLHGCHEILEATNYWRRQRGERPLAYPSSSHA